MFLITDGTLNIVTDAIVVDRVEEIPDALATMRRRIAARGGDPETITVNTVGEPITYSLEGGFNA